MPGVTERLSERLGLAAVISPISLTTAASVATSGLLDMSKAARALFELAIGAQTGSIQLDIQQSATTAATDFAAFATALQATGLTAANIQQLIEVAASKMAAGKRYLRAIVTFTGTSTNTALVALAALTGDHHYEPQTTVATTVQTTVVRD